MAKLIIQGGQQLTGSVSVSGNKNSALKLLAATLLTTEKSTISNVPQIHDVEVMAQVMQELGAKVTKDDSNTYTIDPSGVNTHIISKELSGRIRTAPLLIAPLLHRFGKSQITTHGGCSLGLRLLSTHFDLLTQMGAKVSQREGGFDISFTKSAKTRDVFLEEMSVTATELGMLFAAGLPGKTIIGDAACEPHIVDLAHMLTKMGANIKGAGTNTVEITGSHKLSGVSHTVTPDHVEAGTWAIAAAATGSNLIIKGADPEDLRIIRAYMKHLGVQDKITSSGDWEILPSKLEFDGQIKEFQTRPWPGFPTDLMSPFVVLASQTKGAIVCHDWMYEWRMFFVDDLVKMGAKLVIADTHRVVLLEPKRLKGEKLVCKDIRAGIAIVIAALTAKGTSEIDKIEVVERGYENILGKLQGLGVVVERVD